MTNTQVVKKYDNATIVSGATNIIERAIKNGVSDIHIEPQEQSVVVRYRLNGSLYVANKLPKITALPLAKHFKKMAKLDESQKVAPQAGDYEMRVGRQTYKLSVATLPLLDGEKITLKVSAAVPKSLSLESLGLWGESLINIKRALADPRGVIVIASQSAAETNRIIAAMLQAFESSPIKLASIGKNEDLPQVVKQVSVKSDNGLNLSRQIILMDRHGYDVIAVDRATDHEAVKSIIRTAQEGKLIIAGIPGDSAVAGLVFIQRAARTVHASSTVRAVLGQMFINGLCKYCRQAYKPSSIQRKHLADLFQTDQPAVMKRIHELEKDALVTGIGIGTELGSSEEEVKYLYKVKTHGCKNCEHTGYSGQVNLFEVCIPSEDVIKSLSNGAPINELQNLAIKDGMISLKVDSLIKALRGLIEISV